MHFQEDTQSEILRYAQDDNRGAFFRSLLEAHPETVFLPSSRTISSLFSMGTFSKWPFQDGPLGFRLRIFASTRYNKAPHSDLLGLFSVSRTV
jgi:hypothetical protein